MLKGINHNLVISNRYIVRFAQNKNELLDAQRLRFKIFNLELGEGLFTSYERQLDIDQYDEQCHHLLVIERESEKVIGTYRMQTYSTAKQFNGFYTAEEYNLAAIPDEVLEGSVEVGRACIEKEHRNGRVLYLLWRGLAEYMNQKKARYLFGCCSITSQDTKEAWAVMRYLEKNAYIHPSVLTETKNSYRCEMVDITDDSWEKIVLPQLFRLYVDLGAKVCSQPAIDREFKTIDFLVLLDVENLDERTRLLFFK